MGTKIGQRKIDYRKSVNMTLRESTIKRLEGYKKKNKIAYLSPMIDDMLVDWLDNQLKSVEILRLN